MQNICIISGEGVTGLSNMKNSFKSKLTWYLLKGIIVAALIAVAVAFPIVHFGLNYLESIYDNPEINRKIQVRYIKEVQEYIDTEQVTTDTIAQLQGWTSDNMYIYLAVYWNGKMIFNSDYALENEELSVEEDVQSTELFYPLYLADGIVVNADIFCYNYWQYEYYIWGIAVGIGIIVFIVAITRMIQKKIRYINNICKELQILEGGNLEYPITIKGNDEISNLARGIEQMRLSIVENAKKEREMRQVNKDLVTSMSHDLRTPLTTLNGYLEILSMEHVKDEEKRKNYLKLSLEKAHEIKELSDDLFEYFLIYGEGEKTIALEEVSAWMLAEDLIENQFLALEEEGFQISGKNHLSQGAGNCLVNSKYMQRVLNNIASNLEKYAEKSVPIQVCVSLEQSYMVIQVKNRICKKREVHESTKIGLITCERVMKLHYGEFQKYETDEEFTVKLILPMQKTE